MTKFALGFSPMLCRTVVPDDRCTGSITVLGAHGRVMCTLHAQHRKMIVLQFLSYYKLSHRKLRKIPCLSSPISAPHRWVSSRSCRQSRTKLTDPSRKKETHMSIFPDRDLAMELAILMTINLVALNGQLGHPRHIVVLAISLSSGIF